MAGMKKVSLKLLIDTKGHRVLFAEAGEEIVNFLSDLFSLPIGTVVNLVSAESMVGSVGNLYESIQRLKKFYKCSQNSCGRAYYYVTDNPGTKCPSCGHCMCEDLCYVAPTDVTTFPSNNRYVKGVLNYMVMGNLEIKPMSKLSSIALLNKFDVKDVSSLVERDVRLGPNEALAILKASFKTQDVLTTVFLGVKTECA